MAADKISEIFDVEAIVKQKNEVEKSIQSIINKMEGMTKEIQGFYQKIGECQGILDLKKAIEDSDKVQKKHTTTIIEFNKLMQEKDRLESKLTESLRGQLKAVEKVRQEVSEHTRAIKEEVKAEREREKANKASSSSIEDVIKQLKRQRDSVSELNAENKRLRDLKNSMDTNTQKAEIEQINTVIDANTALVQLNSDAYVKQKMNIGNYKSAVEGLDTIMSSLQGEMKRLAVSGGENSEEFKKLNVEFEKAKEKADEFSSKLNELVGSATSVKGELREIKEQLQSMEATGQANSEMYATLSARAVELTGVINGVNDQIRNMESPTSTFDSIMSGLKGLSGGFEVFQGVMGFCNLESEDFNRIQTKVQSAMAITNGLTAVSAALDKDSALMTGLKTASESKNIVVKKTAIVVQAALNAVMKANPIALLVMGLLAGAAALGAWLASTKEATEEQKRQNEIHDKAIDGYVKEKTEIEGLAGKIKAGNSTRQDQARVIEILTQKYGENYVKGKSMQEMEQTFVDNADAFVEAAMKRAEAQAAFELAVEAQKKALEAGTKGVEEYVGWWGRLFRTEETEGKLAEERRLKEVKDMEAQSQHYLEIQGEKQQGALDAMKKSGELSEVEKKAEADKTKQLEIEIKQRAELKAREQKASEQIMVLQWQRSAECQKNIYDDEENSFEVRVAALESYTIQMEEIINEQRDFQISSTKAVGKERELIEANAQNAIIKVREQGAKDMEKLEAQETTRKMAAIVIASDAKLSKIQSEGDKEMMKLAKQYSRGEIKEEEYQKAKLEIQKRCEDEMLQETIKSLQERIAIADIEPEEKERLTKELNQKLVDYNKWKNAQVVADDEKTGEKRKEIESKLRDARIELAQQAFDTITSITNSMFERKIEEVDMEIEKVEEQKEAQLAAVDEMDISQEEREERKKAIEAKAEAEKEKLEKKKKKLQLEQAKADKAQAIVQVAINTALAIMRIWADVPKMDFGISTGVLTGIAAAMGAMQIATIAAQPLPKYAMGTDNHPGGLAVVGDGGRKELVKTPEGDLFITPNTSTLVNLPKHSEVLPDFNLALKNFSFAPIVRDDLPNYNARIESEIIELRKAINEVTEAVKLNKTQMNINLDKNGVWSTYEKQKGRTTYLNESLNIRR